MGQFKTAQLSGGTFSGSGTGYRGTVVIEVKTEPGKISSVIIKQMREDWPASNRQRLPKKIVEVQGISGVDAVTGATYTSDAIINAAAQALGKAKK